MSLSPLPTRTELNLPLQERLPLIAYTFPLEVLVLDEDFINSEALDDISDIRQPLWRDNPRLINYRGTFVINGQIGTSMQWGARDVKAPNLWDYLKKKYGMKDGDFIQITNAIPTYARLAGVVSVAAAVKMQKEKAKQGVANV